MTRKTGSAAAVSAAGALALMGGLLAGCAPAWMAGSQAAHHRGIDGPAAAGPVGAGSFPRSFLIPGTDTSIRIGG